MSFQDELKKNIRSQGDIQIENKIREHRRIKLKAQNTMDQIKKQLIQNAKTTHYTTQNGTKIISCICSIDQQYMHIESKSNNDQLIQNEKNSFLDKDQDLISKSWDVFQMEPKYKNEFIHYISELQKMARNDNIQVECVVYDSKDNTVYAFPGITDRKLTAYYQLSIHATTII